MVLGKNITRIMLITMLTSTACSEKDKAEATKAPVVGASEVVATVNGESITSAELELAIERTLGSNAGLFMTDELANKLLQSLVASKAIAQKSEALLSADELIMLDLKAKAFKEELLVKAYLEQNVTPQPVSAEMVKKYYLDNPSKFGGGSIKQFEYIQVQIQEKDDASHLLKAFNELSAHANWVLAVEDIKAVNGEWVVRHKTASLNPKDLREPLKTLVTKTNVGKVAPVDINGLVYTLVKVVEEKPLALKPLAEVSGKIRETLAPLQLKQAVKEISDAALKEAAVVYQQSKYLLVMMRVTLTSY